ncbi:hypothetical protein ABZS94_34725, partial [Streptomyces sp. NPDC005500]|uniref:hypothetical protein n=1 Tax=Streptomyces sp. NPDC005500 TaxID=3155007 RepID=UPI00339E1253
PTGYEECADCPIWKQDDGGSGIATEEFEDMMADANAFFENGDWGINPVNGDSPAAHRLETYYERHIAHAEAAAKKAAEAKAKAYAEAKAKEASQKLAAEQKAQTKGLQQLKNQINGPMYAQQDVCNTDGGQCTADTATDAGPNYSTETPAPTCDSSMVCTDTQAAERHAAADAQATANNAPPLVDGLKGPNFVSVGYELSSAALLSGKGPSLGANVGGSINVGLDGKFGFAGWLTISSGATASARGIPVGVASEGGYGLAWNNQDGWGGGWVDGTLLKAGPLRLGGPSSGASWAAGYNEGPWRLKVGSR